MNKSNKTINWFLWLVRMVVLCLGVLLINHSLIVGGILASLGVFLILYELKRLKRKGVI